LLRLLPRCVLAPLSQLIMPILSFPLYLSSYPCSILNAGVNKKFANPQYHTMSDTAKREYRVSREVSVARFPGHHLCMSRAKESSLCTYSPLPSS